MQSRRLRYGRTRRLGERQEAAEPETSAAEPEAIDVSDQRQGASETEARGPAEADMLAAATSEVAGRGEDERRLRPRQ